jgi:hypothetical protein
VSIESRAPVDAADGTVDADPDRRAEAGPGDPRATFLLAAGFVMATAADVITFLALPPGMEANPIVAELPVTTAVVARLLLIGAVLCLTYVLRDRWRLAADAVLIVGIAVGIVGAWSNTA